MRILIAGASGAIGRPLVRRLRANQHEIFALTRPPDSARLKEIGAEPVIADALDAVAVKTAVGRIQPHALINELTSLPQHYAPAEMKAAAERDRKVRVEGNINLLAALCDAGVRRYLLQSSGFWYAPGAGPADESVPFISSASPGVEASARTYLELEARASAMPGIEFGRRSHVLQERLRRLASAKKRRLGRQAPMRSTTRRGLGALRTRKPGASSSSVRAPSSGFKDRIKSPINHVQIQRLGQPNWELARLMQLFDEFAHGWAGFG